MAGAGLICLAFGHETACVLCTMINMDAAATVVSLGLPIPQDPAEARESAFWAHLARRTDGGPSNAAELYAWQRRRRDRFTPAVETRVRAAIADQSPLPDEPPF